MGGRTTSTNTNQHIHTQRKKHKHRHTCAPAHTQATSNKKPVQQMRRRHKPAANAWNLLNNTPTPASDKPVEENNNTYVVPCTACIALDLGKLHLKVRSACGFAGLCESCRSCRLRLLTRYVLKARVTSTLILIGASPFISSQSCSGTLCVTLLHASTPATGPNVFQGCP